MPSRTALLLLSVILLAQTLLYRSASGSEQALTSRPLRELPAALGSWHMLQESFVEPEIQAVLRADDTLTRVYASPGHTLPASLFVAYFKSQRAGQAPHSPKNCLPGAGWVQNEYGTIAVAVDGLAEPITINRFVVAKGSDKSVVLYWYQSRSRVIASEYWAKYHLVADALRDHRTDTALVRVVTPVSESGEKAATDAAVDFVRQFFTPLKAVLPS